MARRRMIDPSIWDDEDVGSLSDGAFRLFVACISSADDYGKLEGSAIRLRGIAFRFRSISIARVQKSLDELATKVRSVRRYGVNGREYIRLVNWAKYQTINREFPSKIPDPPNNLDRDGGSVTDRSRPSHEPLHERSRTPQKESRSRGKNDESCTDHAPIINQSALRERERENKLDKLDKKRERRAHGRATTATLAKKSTTESEEFSPAYQVWDQIAPGTLNHQVKGQIDACCRIAGIYATIGAMRKSRKLDMTYIHGIVVHSREEGTLQDLEQLGGKPDGRNLQLDPRDQIAAEKAFHESLDKIAPRLRKDKPNAK